MKFPNTGSSYVGSIKARCKSHKNKILLTFSIIATLVMLMTSLMATPAEATFTTDGYGIFVDGNCVVQTLNESDAYAILTGIKEKYIVEGSNTVSQGFAEKVTVKAAKIVVQDTKNVEDGIEYIASSEPSLLTVMSEQRNIVYEELAENDAYIFENYSYNSKSKISADNYTGTKVYTIQSKLENEEVISQEIVEKKLMVTAQNLSGYKGTPFTKDGKFTMNISFIEPVEMNITCAYGENRAETGYHLGVDLYNPYGTPIIAAGEGIVTHVGYESSYGKLIIIDHGGNVQTYYAHCSSTDVEVGDKVLAGDYIGAVGSTGRSTGSHLHFELRLNSFTLDPMDYL